MKLSRPKVCIRDPVHTYKSAQVFRFIYRSCNGRIAFQIDPVSRLIIFFCILIVLSFTISFIRPLTAAGSAASQQPASGAVPRGRFDSRQRPLQTEESATSALSRSGGPFSAGPISVRSAAPEPATPESHLGRQHAPGTPRIGSAGRHAAGFSSLAVYCRVGTSLQLDSKRHVELDSKRRTRRYHTKTCGLRSVMMWKLC